MTQNKKRLKWGLRIIAIIVIILLLLKSCEDDSSNENIIVMQHNTSYEVFPGDKIEPHTSDANITVVHEYSTDKKFVTLHSGDASLIRGNAIVIDQRQKKE